MESNVLCSVIVPVYNVEKYLRRCLDSLKNQEGNDFEVILVDDGSTDNSLEICNEYAATDMRFKAIHKENGGVSSARNVGLDQATGKYIAFVDSDDYVTKDYFEVLRPLMLQGHELIVFNNYHELGGGKAQTYNRGLEERVYTIEELKKVNKLSEYYEHFLTLIGGVPWNKLFDNDIIKSFKIRFNPDIKYGEDFIFLINYLYHINTIYLCNHSLYVYAMNVMSATRAINFDGIKSQPKDYLFLINERDKYLSFIHLEIDFTTYNFDVITEWIKRCVKGKVANKQVTNALKEAGIFTFIKKLHTRRLYYKMIKFLIALKAYKLLRYYTAFMSRFHISLFETKNAIIVTMNDIMR